MKINYFTEENYFSYENFYCINYQFYFILFKVNYFKFYLTYHYYLVNVL